ncbi:MAG: alpha/beta hydrolase [Acidimicrobiales bacterium]
METRRTENEGRDEMESFESFDGVRIAYEEIGQGDATLLHHGFASDSRINWVRPGVARAIADAGRRVVLIDARGHGRSEKPHGVEAYLGGAMERDVRALLDRLEIEEVAMVGYSMGSFVAIRLAVSDPRVRSLVLGGTGSAPASTSSLEQSESIAEALEADDKSAIRDPKALAFRNFAEATGADRLALAAIQRARCEPPGEESFRAITVPTLVVNGERDALLGPLDSLVEAMPQAELKLVPGNHTSVVVKPEFRQAIVEFLSKN